MNTIISSISNNQSLLRKIIIGLFVVNAFLFLYFIFGFGKVTIDAKENSVVFVNENNVGSKPSLRLRPGSYTVRIAEKSTKAQAVKVTVLPFGNKIVSAEDATPVDIIQSARNAPQTTSKISATESILSDDKSWLVARYTYGEQDVTMTAAMKYIANSWQVVAVYPDNTNDTLEQMTYKLPDSIAKIFNEMVAKNAAD